MQKKRIKQIGAMACSVLFLVVLPSCQKDEQDWWGDQPLVTDAPSTAEHLITETPTESPAEQLAPFLATWELKGNRCSFSLTEDNAVLYTDLTANRHATCSYEFDAKKHTLTLHQIDPDADGASLKSGGMICILEDKDHLKKTFLDGNGEITLTRVKE